MTLSRRQLLGRGAGLAATWLAARGSRRAGAAGHDGAHHGTAVTAGPGRVLQSATLAHFVDPLPVPPVARSAGTQPDPARPGHTVPLYRVAMREIEVQVHRDLKPTRCWSYGAGMPGPTFDVRSGQPIAVEWKNELPARHFLPIDHTLCGADATLPDVRTVVHVHGSRVPPESDGYPDRWFAPGGARLVHYPNRQDAATLWYHDHAMGIERLNQYAGLFGAYLVRDSVEDALGLPGGPYEIPLFLFDRYLDVDGQLIYPTSGIPETPWISGLLGNTILVNGKLMPDLAVERRPYRFRIFNASNARLLPLSLSGGAPFVQIGSDQGLLPRPVSRKLVLVAPGERVDVVIDFGALGGQSVILMSQAFQLMQFRVAPGPAASAWQPPQVLRDVPRTPRASAVKTRTLTLEERPDPKHGSAMLLDGKRWRDPVSEKPMLDSVEIWELVNYMDETHPIHLHLVRFQVLERQPYDAVLYERQRKLKLIGAPVPPEPHELGWKDTVQVPAEMVTRIIVRFEGYTGRYVWHCHVLEHAANEMMRPFEVVKAASRRT
jgi:spore coat protein A